MGLLEVLNQAQQSTVSSVSALRIFLWSRVTSRCPCLSASAPAHLCVALLAFPRQKVSSRLPTSVAPRWPSIQHCPIQLCGKVVSNLACDILMASAISSCPALVKNSIEYDTFDAPDDSSAAVCTAACLRESDAPLGQRYSPRN